MYQLNTEHNCLIHFTRGYNETIDSLLIMGQILGQSLDDAASTTAVGVTATIEAYGGNDRNNQGNNGSGSTSIVDRALLSKAIVEVAATAPSLKRARVEEVKAPAPSLKAEVVMAAKATPSSRARVEVAATDPTLKAAPSLKRARWNNNM